MNDGRMEQEALVGFTGERKPLGEWTREDVRAQHEARLIVGDVLDEPPEAWGEEEEPGAGELEAEMAYRADVPAERVRAWIEEWMGELAPSALSRASVTEVERRLGREKERALDEDPA